MSDNRCENCQKTFDKCRDDMAFVQTYYQGLEGMKTLLTRERDEARARIADLEKYAATLTGLANQYKAERDSLEETCRIHSARVIELEKEVVYQRKLYEEAIDNKPPARRDVESDHYYNAAFDGVDYGKVAYERFRELPATPKDAAPWDRLKGAERNEWRAIVAPVVERVRAEKNEPMVVALQNLRKRVDMFLGAGEIMDTIFEFIDTEIASITDTTRPTKPAKAEGNVNRSGEKKIMINIETDGRPLSDPLVVAEVEKLLAHVKGEP